MNFIGIIDPQNCSNNSRFSMPDVSFTTGKHSFYRFSYSEKNDGWDILSRVVVYSSHRGIHPTLFHFTFANWKKVDWKKVGTVW